MFGRKHLFILSYTGKLLQSGFASPLRPHKQTGLEERRTLRRGSSAATPAETSWDKIAVHSGGWLKIKNEVKKEYANECADWRTCRVKDKAIYLGNGTGLVHQQTWLSYPHVKTSRARLMIITVPSLKTVLFFWFTHIWTTRPRDKEHK